MDIQIRPAAIADAERIARLKQAVWPDDTADPALIASVIQRPDHASHVVLMDDELAGFVSGFITVAADGVTRWEIDLLAVATPYRGKGLAARLVAASVSAGLASGAVAQRALVRVGNIPSERAFARNGFQPETVTSQLYITGAAANTALASPGLHLIPVTTFGYKGVWLEGVVTEAGFQAARALCAANHWDIAGAVISTADLAALESARAAGCEYAGDFRWWWLR